MKIESNLLEISKVIFDKKQNWKFVTNEQKEQFFFIFNRLFARRYPQLSQLINDKSIDKSLGLDLWFYFMEEKPYPQWFWQKNKKSIEEDNQVILEELRIKNQMNKQEFEFLLKNFPEEINEEINYLKEQKNGNTTKKLVHNKGTK